VLGAQRALTKLRTSVVRRGISAVSGLLLAGACIAGCATSPARFPAPLVVRTEDAEVVLAYDTNNDRRVDYWQYQGADGRKHAQAYADDPTGPGARIELDQVPAADCPHLLLVLDGVPFDVVADMYRDGHFRLFYPPVRVVCCFPSMTDLALNELFHAGPGLGYQALYYDRAAERLSDGHATYLRGDNSPWLAHVHYRCSLAWDMLVYLDPQTVFHHELTQIARRFAEFERGLVRTYSVGTAGLGTRGGRAAIEKYLADVDRFCEQLVYERRGAIKITLTADHGHNLTTNRRVDFDQVLRAGGYRPARRLASPRDVVTISYGLVTYAEFHTRDPAGVARCLLDQPDVEFACFPDGDQVVVLNRNGQARIRRTATGYTYDCQAGDPLGLAAVIEELRQAGKVAADGTIDEAALFALTVTGGASPDSSAGQLDTAVDASSYPDPLRRIWSAFHGLVRNPPDVIVNLRDGACHGSGFFHAMIRQVSSTHGSLNRRNSLTFALTMVGRLPPALRTDELLPAVEALSRRVAK